MAIKCPSKGVDLGGKLLQVLLYADDLVILAESPQDLQALLDALHSFCRLNGMTVNIKKSDALVFNPPSGFSKPPILYNGNELTWQSSFIYLGMLFHEFDGMALAGERSLSKGRGAMFALLRRCHEIDLHNVHLKLHLFDSLVKPILLYGCEVWLPALLGRHRHISNNPFFQKLETMHKKFMKQCLGLRPSTCDSILMIELNRQPIYISALKQVFTFRNKIMSRPENDLTKLAMLESIEMARGGQKCWASRLARYYPTCLGIEDLPMSLLDPTTTPVTPIDSSTFSVVRDRPDSINRGTKSFVYNSWFSNPDSHPKRTFWFNLHRPHQICAVARYRMGAHRLNVESGRWGHVPRSRRICTCCNLGVVEDELHLLYCPMYIDLRFYYNIHIRESGQIDNSMREVMNACDYNGWQCLADYLVACFKRRHDFISRGVRLISLVNNS